MVTLKDIAKHVGISVSATSMALRNDESIGRETRRRVWEAKEALGYVVRSKPSGNIAFVLLDRGFDSMVYARFFQRIGELAATRQQQPLYLALSSSDVVNGVLPPILEKRGVDGMIVSGVYDEASHKVLSGLDIPLVALGNYQLGDAWAACETDVVGGMMMAVQTLAQLGHRRIALMASSHESREFGQQVRRGFTQALSRLGLPAGRIADEGELHSSEESNLAAGIRSLLGSSEPPTALIVEKANAQIYDACEELGLRVPADVSIIALGRPECQLRPALTTVESDPAQCAWGAFEKLQRLIAKPSTPRTREIFGMHLVPGQSIAPARSAETGENSPSSAKLGGKLSA